MEHLSRLDDLLVDLWSSYAARSSADVTRAKLFAAVLLCHRIATDLCHLEKYGECHQVIMEAQKLLNEDAIPQAQRVLTESDRMATLLKDRTNAIRDSFECMRNRTSGESMCRPPHRLRRSNARNQEENDGVPLELDADEDVDGVPIMKVNISAARGETSNTPDEQRHSARNTKNGEVPKTQSHEHCLHSEQRPTPSQQREGKEHAGEENNRTAKPRTARRPVPPVPTSQEPVEPRVASAPRPRATPSLNLSTRPPADDTQKRNEEIATREMLAAYMSASVQTEAPAATVAFGVQASVETPTPHEPQEKSLSHTPVAPPPLWLIAHRPRLFLQTDAQKHKLYGQYQEELQRLAAGRQQTSVADSANAPSATPRRAVAIKAPPVSSNQRNAGLRPKPAVVSATTSVPSTSTNHDPEFRQSAPVGPDPFTLECSCLRIQRTFRGFAARRVTRERKNCVAAYLSDSLPRTEALPTITRFFRLVVARRVVMRRQQRIKFINDERVSLECEHPLEDKEENRPLAFVDRLAETHVQLAASYVRPRHAKHGSLSAGSDTPVIPQHMRGPRCKYGMPFFPDDPRRHSLVVVQHSIAQRAISRCFRAFLDRTIFAQTVANEQYLRYILGRATAPIAEQSLSASMASATLLGATHSASQPYDTARSILSLKYLPLRKVKLSQLAQEQARIADEARQTSAQALEQRRLTLEQQQREMQRCTGASQTIQRFGRGFRCRLGLCTEAARRRRSKGPAYMSKIRAPEAHSITPLINQLILSPAETERALAPAIHLHVMEGIAARNPQVFGQRKERRNAQVEGAVRLLQSCLRHHAALLERVARFMSSRAVIIQTAWRTHGTATKRAMKATTDTQNTRIAFIVVSSVPSVE